jgi:hypothetical protein
MHMTAEFPSSEEAVFGVSFSSSSLLWWKPEAARDFKAHIIAKRIVEAYISQMTRRNGPICVHCGQPPRWLSHKDCHR